MKRVFKMRRGNKSIRELLELLDALVYSSVCRLGTETTLGLCTSQDSENQLDAGSLAQISS